MFRTSRQQLPSVLASSFGVLARVAAQAACASETKSHYGTGIVQCKCSQLGLVCALYPSVVTQRKTENWMAQLSPVARSISWDVLHAWIAEKTEQRWMEARETNFPRGSLYSAAYSVWIYMTHYCWKPTLMAVRPDWHNLIWIFVLSLWCLTPFQRSTSCHLLCGSQCLIQTHSLMDRGADICMQPGKWLEMLNVVVMFLQSYPAHDSLTISSQLMVTGKENKMLWPKRSMLPAPGSKIAILIIWI